LVFGLPLNCVVKRTAGRGFDVTWLFFAAQPLPTALGRTGHVLARAFRTLAAMQSVLQPTIVPYAAQLGLQVEQTEPHCKVRPMPNATLEVLPKSASDDFSFGDLEVLC
jgi:hypothetical protein